MYIQLTYKHGNGIYDSKVKIVSDNEIDCSSIDTIEDNGVVYWQDGDLNGIAIPLPDNIEEV